MPHGVYTGYMDLLIENAREIMFLSIGVGVLVLCVTLSVLIWNTVRTVKNINKVSGEVEKYVAQPMLALQNANRFINKFFKG